MVKCPVCSHPQHDMIEDDLTQGVDLMVITRAYRISHDDLVVHLRHGLGDESDIDEEVGELLSQATDEYSILRFDLLNLRNRYRRLIAVSPATAESKELIQLSRAINETVKTLLIVRKEIGQTDDTRIQQLEKMFNELMMTLPALCEKDQKIIERALGIESIVEGG